MESVHIGVRVLCRVDSLTTLKRFIYTNQSNVFPGNMQLIRS